MHAPTRLDPSRAWLRRRRTKNASLASVAAGVIIAQVGARAIAHLLVPQLPTAASLLVETIAVGLVLAIAAWRLLWAPMVRRGGLDRAGVPRPTAVRHPLVSAPQRSLQLVPDQRARHLRLVD